jgi:hypothetical protein
LVFTVFGFSAAFSQTTEFSYQGFLSDNSASANGSFDLEFRLFDAASGGAALAALARPGVTVTNGVFNVVLDFGAFPPSNRYLEIGVRPSGGGAFTTLAPRSKILSTPLATIANNATTANNSLQLGGVAANQFVQTTDARLSDSRNPLPNSTNYVQNRTTVQTSTNFNISGNGTVGGTLTADIVSAGTQFSLGANRVLAKVGQNNLFLGTLAGSANGGIQNTLLGDSAGRDNTGNENTFVGFVAGQLSTTGSNNTFVGSRAGMGNTTGSNNTFFGYNADAGSNNLTNATAIGANALVEQNNSIVLGSISGVNGATASTDVGIGITVPARKLDVNGIIRVGSTTGSVGCIEDRDGTVIAGTCASDLRFKKNITPFGNVLANFSKLRPVNYFWRTEEFSEQRFGSKQSFGLVAQEVEPLFPDLVSTDEKGFKAVNYSRLPLLTIQAVIELKAENDALKQRFEKQRQQFALQQQQLQKQQKELDQLKKLVSRRQTFKSKKGGKRR